MFAQITLSLSALSCCAVFVDVALDKIKARAMQHKRDTRQMSASVRRTLRSRSFHFYAKH